MVGLFFDQGAVFGVLLRGLDGVSVQFFRQPGNFPRGRTGVDDSFGGGSVDLGHGLDHCRAGRFNGTGLQGLIKFLNGCFNPRFYARVTQVAYLRLLHPFQG
jgi:hypothetical protein